MFSKESTLLPFRLVRFDSHLFCTLLKRYFHSFPCWFPVLFNLIIIQLYCGLIGHHAYFVPRSISFPKMHNTYFEQNSRRESIFAIIQTTLFLEFQSHAYFFHYCSCFVHNSIFCLKCFSSPGSLDPLILRL